MAGPFAKAQQPQPSPDCINQCVNFCNTLTSNFTSGGTGPFNDQTFNNLIAALPEGSPMKTTVTTFQTQYMDPALKQMNQYRNLQNFLGDDCYPGNCARDCTPYSPPAKSTAQKPSVGPQSVKK